jgi:hypothetical protein
VKQTRVLPVIAAQDHPSEQLAADSPSETANAVHASEAVLDVMVPSGLQS